MNYLAHFYLARGDDGLIVGNMLADFLRGNQHLELPVFVQRGVLLHRQIDSFTDSHQVVEKTKKRLRKKYRKYTPVIVDVFYDYFLGKNWDTYSELKLEDFSQQIYSILHEHHHLLTEEAQLTLSWMSEKDWLFHYSTYFGIEKALQGLSSRTTFTNNMPEAIADLKNQQDEIEPEFTAFFNDLIKFVDSEKKQL